MAGLPLKIAGAVAGAVFVSIYLANGPYSNQPPSRTIEDRSASVTAVDPSWMNAATESVLSDRVVVDAMFPNGASTSFWASVRDDGTRRDGYAQSICAALHQSGMPAGAFTVIHVWDAAAMARNELKELGRAECRG